MGNAERKRIGRRAFLRYFGRAAAGAALTQLPPAVRVNAIRPEEESGSGFYEKDGLVRPRERVISPSSRQNSDGSRIFLPQVFSEWPAGLKNGVGASYTNSPDLLTQLRLIKASFLHGWKPDMSEEASKLSGAEIEVIATVGFGPQIGLEAKGNTNILFTLNEPDVKGQANMSPPEAAREWLRIEDFYHEMRLISPTTVNNPEYPEFQWLKRWYQAFKSLDQNTSGRPPRLDGLGVHWYGFCDNLGLAEFQTYMRAAVALAKQWGLKEVWLSEFAFLPENPDQWPDPFEGWKPESARLMVEALNFLVRLQRETGIAIRVAWFQLWFWGNEPWAWGLKYNTSLLIPGAQPPQRTVLGENYAGENHLG